MGRTLQAQMEGDGHGIKELLAAEKEAAAIVADAKKQRQDKMKKAKEDANREIEAYRAQKEKEFLAYKQQHSTGGSESSESLRRQTDEAKTQLSSEASANRSKVVDLLVQFVTTVKA